MGCIKDGGGLFTMCVGDGCCIPVNNKQQNKLVRNAFHYNTQVKKATDNRKITNKDLLAITHST